VDPAVPTSEMAPRYYTKGTYLVEVVQRLGHEHANAVVLDVLYVWRPDDLDVSATGALTQAVSVPDRFANVLVYALGAYLCEKDVGRGDAEVSAACEAERGPEDWITAEAQFGGTAVYTFVVPVPTATSKN
jgi:hypothetical protein